MTKLVSKKAMEKRVDAAYYATCNGIQVNMMDLPKIKKVGMDAVAAGVTEDELRAKIWSFVESIRTN